MYSAHHVHKKCFSLILTFDIELLLIGNDEDYSAIVIERYFRIIQADLKCFFSV